MFRRFGSRVTVVQRERQILPHEDADVAEALQQALEAEGVHFLLGATATRVEKELGGVALSVVVEGKSEDGARVPPAGRPPDAGPIPTTWDCKRPECRPINGGSSA